MGVRPAGAGGAALVDECEHGCEAGSVRGLRPQPPGGRNGPQLGFGEIGEREDVVWDVDHHLVAAVGRARLERWRCSSRCLSLDEEGIEVRHDADLPAGRVWLAVALGEGKRLGRSLALVALAERTRCLVPGVVRGGSGHTGPEAAAGSDDDVAPRERVDAQFRVGSVRTVGRCDRPESAAASRGMA